ncbi:hypothetical protein ACEXAG_11640 [Citrobacter freundii]|uniref:tail fiber/spike domain-containing protein n=1 Tax=Citrobacter freundii TaxID=546 RepID=UPI0035A87A37
MSTTPTNLPVPSEKPQDLKFNAGKIDEFVTSMAKQYIDRFGHAHYTIEGLRWVAQQAISAFGYITLKSFQLGAPLPNNELTLPNQVLQDESDGEYYRWDGVFPKQVPAGSTPQSTGGKGVGAWLSVGDAPLRGELFSEYILYKTPQAFDAIGDGIADDTIPLQNAMDYCQINNIKLVIPSGRYRITKPLLYRNQGFYNYEIEGQGGAAVIIMDSLAKTGITAPDAFGDDFNVNAAMVVLNDTNQSKYCRISGLRFESPVGAEYAIYAGQAENTYIHDCFWTGFTFGWYDLGSWVTRVERCIARDIVDTGFFKKNGTSTYIAECYADRMERGYYLGGGYSAIINCACDLTTRWGFYLYGGRTGSDLATFSIKGCGSEQSGTDSVFYVDGLVALSIEDHNAGNDPTVQPAPAALLSMASNTSYSQVVLKNIRTVNVDTLILDAADHNYFDLTNVTCRSPMSKKYYLGSNSRVLERTYDGERFITSNDQVGIGFAESDIVDGWTDLTLSGLRNGQFIIRRTVSIQRTSGDAGFASITLPFNMNINYAVVANLEADFSTLQSVCPSYSVTEKTPSSFKLCASSAKNNTTWSAIDVEVIIYGIKA